MWASWKFETQSQTGRDWQWRASAFLQFVGRFGSGPARREDLLGAAIAASLTGWAAAVAVAVPAWRAVEAAWRPVALGRAALHGAIGLLQGGRHDLDGDKAHSGDGCLLLRRGRAG